MNTDTSTPAPPRRFALPFRHPAAALIGAIIVLLTLFAFWVPGGRFLTTENLLDLAQQISVNAIIAFGMTLVILIGGIDLSVGAVVALVGVVTVTFLPHGLAAGLGMGALTAAVIGAAPARLLRARGCHRSSSRWR